MLDASDQERLREIEAQLLAEDPQFVALMRGEDTSYRGTLLTLAALWTIWGATLLSIAALGWPLLVVDAAALLVLAPATRWVLRRRHTRAFVVG
jgi:hypothetical protein